MFEAFMRLLARVLSVMFVMGIVGCRLVIPITAYQLFSVLFKKDHPDEEQPDAPKA